MPLRTVYAWAALSGETAKSLPQRELSAVRLTEGLLYQTINIHTNVPEITVDLIIGNANDFQTIALQKSGALCVLSQIAILVMLGAVQLYHKPGSGTVKVSNVSPQYLLSGKPHRIGTQKIIPEMALFFCHVLSQLLCRWNELLIMFRLHYNPSVTASPCHLPLHKGGQGVSAASAARIRRGASCIAVRLQSLRHGFAVPPPFTQGRLRGGCGVSRSDKAWCVMHRSALTIPPSRLRRATSLCTREAKGWVRVSRLPCAKGAVSRQAD